VNVSCGSIPNVEQKTNSTQFSIKPGGLLTAQTVSKLKITDAGGNNQRIIG
jgi:hypothetical protein